MRGGRLVLVLQSGAKGRTGGLVHGRSATGKSFYFEPLHVVETNNTLQQSVEDEEAERHRILVELIEAARAALPDLREHARFLGDLDLLQASVRFGDRCGASLPEIGARHDLRLLAARHPLLDPSLSEIREEALGQAGHFGRHRAARHRAFGGPAHPRGHRPQRGRQDRVPQDGRHSGPPRPVRPADARQAREAGCRSSGGWWPRWATSRTCWPTARPSAAGCSASRRRGRRPGSDSLILLDELGSGTDPEEGAALAVALLEGLLEKGSLGVITTHLTQLAAAALELPGATCAAMEFDPDTGRPTFRLVPGPPGGSEALALARRLGLPADWLDRAEARLGTEHRDLRRLIAEVERVRQELSETRDRLEIEHSDAEKLRRRLAEERAALEEERRNTAKKMRTELEDFRRQTSERLRREEERLRERFEEGRRKGLAAEAVQTLFSEVPAFGPVEELGPSGPLAVGEPVRHLGLGWQGMLEKLEDGRAEVVVRGKRVRCRPDELVPAKAAPESSKDRSREAAVLREMRPSSSLATRGDIDETTAVPPEINLIGQRVEPALEQLDAYIDQALLASRKEVRVVHGHGSGRLRQAVREHLRGHRGIAEIRSGAPNEGGNGATVVTFRGA